MANSQDRARAQVAYAIKTGRLVARPCEICGSTPTRAHHDDYSKPLDVRWLCAVHHAAIHGDHGPKPNDATCRNGHPRTPGNTYQHARRNGRIVRECRVCRNDATRRARAA